MKRIISLILLTFSINIHAKDICPNLQSDIEPDHQWKETDFTKEKAQEAIKFFSEIVNNDKSYSWYEPDHY